MSIKEEVEIFFKQELEIAENSNALMLINRKDQVVEYLKALRDRCLQRIVEVEQRDGEHTRGSDVEKNVR